MILHHPTEGWPPIPRQTIDTDTAHKLTPPRFGGVALHRSDGVHTALVRASTGARGHNGMVYNGSPRRNTLIGLGEAISAIGFGGQLWGKFKGARQWKESEQLVNLDWLIIAKEKGLLDSETLSVWRLVADVESTLLEGTFDLVYALDEKRKIKYRLTTGDLVLMARKNRWVS